MSSRRSWSLGERRGVTPIIASTIMIGITIAAGTALWELKLSFPAPAYYVTYVAKAGIKIPTWGDHTDCIPWGYPVSLSKTWNASEWAADNTQCWVKDTGNFSAMNASEIIITSATPPNIPLSRVNFYFFCHNTTPFSITTTLVGGSLAAMTWFPGSTHSPAPNAPHLGVCATFNATQHGGAFGTLYNRLAIFVPVSAGSTVLAPGDTIVLYVHTKNSVYDPGYPPAGVDADDYHGAPPWCFVVPGSCYIQLQYMGTPQQLLATIPIYSISGQAQ